MDEDTITETTFLLAFKNETTATTIATTAEIRDTIPESALSLVGNAATAVATSDKEMMEVAAMAATTTAVHLGEETDTTGAAEEITKSAPTTRPCFF